MGVWCVEGRFLTAGTVGTVARSLWGLVAGLHRSSDAKSEWAKLEVVFCGQ